MTSLSPYEQQQIRLIAGWKSEPPSYLTELLDTLTHPLVKLAEKALPPNTVAEAISEAYLTSEVSAHREKVLERSGVELLHDLWQANLAYCDQLADEFGESAVRHALLNGAGSGGANLFSAMIVVKALLSYCLKTVHTIGYCYGFGTEEPYEREYVLGIMLIASAGSLNEKQRALVNLGTLEEMILEEAFEEIMQDAIAEQLVASGGFSAIPVIGILTGALQFATMTNHVVRIAKFTFQERWLRANNKLDSRISPDRSLARPLVVRAETSISTSIYWATFGISFLVSVPTVWLFSLVPTKNPFGQGLVSGASAASEDADRLISAIKRTSAIDVETGAKGETTEEAVAETKDPSMTVMFNRRRLVNSTRDGAITTAVRMPQERQESTSWLSQMTHDTCYCLAYSVAFPTLFLVRIIPGIRTTTSGIVDGASAAIDYVAELRLQNEAQLEPEWPTTAFAVS